MDVEQMASERRISTGGFIILAAAIVFVSSFWIYQAVLIHQLHATPLPFASAVNPANCVDPSSKTGEPYGQPPSPPFQFPIGGWGLFVLIVCGFAFLTGSIWGRFRSKRHEDNEAFPIGLERTEHGDRHDAAKVLLRSSQPVVLLALVLLLLIVTFALGFEAYTTAHPTSHELWPITLYVRCADDIAPVPTLIGAAVVSVLLGQWLAYRPKLTKG